MIGMSRLIDALREALRTLARQYGVVEFTVFD